MTRTPAAGLVMHALALLLSIVVPCAANPQSSPNSNAQQPQLASLERELQALRRELATLAAELPPADERAGSGKSAEERLDEVEGRIRLLARVIEIERERSRETLRVQAGQDGFSLSNADGSARLKLRGYLQSDGRFYSGASNQSAVNTFVLRRARPIVESTIYGRFDFRIMPDFGDGRAVLQDAYMDARLRPGVSVRAGKFKAPFGIERLVSATELRFVERALPTSLVPNRDLGLMVHGERLNGRVDYAAGIFNGVPDGGSADADSKGGKDVTARLFAQPFRPNADSRWRGLGAGVAVSHGTQLGSNVNPGLPSFRSSGQQTFFSYRSADATGPAAIADGAHTRLSLQGHYHAGAFGTLAEYVISSQEVQRAGDTATLRHSSWQLAGSWVVTGETSSPRGVTPRLPFDPSKGEWGAIELTARYSALNVDAEAFPFLANPVTSVRAAGAWAFGGNWLLNRGVKLSLNYERTRFDGGAATGERPTEHVLLCRTQFSF